METTLKFHVPILIYPEEGEEVQVIAEGKKNVCPATFKTKKKASLTRRGILWRLNGGRVIRVFRLLSLALIAKTWNITTLKITTLF